MNSEIILCKNIKMDRNYNNVLNYSESDMLSLCRTNAISTATDYSFLRATSSIFVAFTYAQCLQANYIAFQNPDYSNKWFFAWIDDVIYKGNNNCEIRFTIDAWSTWFNKVVPHKCFINRQHVNDDTIGLHTVDENLRVQEVVQEGAVIEDFSLKGSFWIAVTTAWLPDDNTSSGGKQFSGITVNSKCVSGTKILIFKITTLADYLNLALYIIRTNGDGHVADMENIFIIPKACIDETKLILHTTMIEGGTSFNYWEITNNVDLQYFAQPIQKLTSFSDYVPKNNKCFVYPYNYLFVSNNQGSQNIFKYEDFSGETASFLVELVLTIGVSGRLVPTNYKGMEQADDEALPLAKYPTCSWSSDAFTNWLTQQSVNLATDLAFGIVGGASSSTGKNVQTGETTINSMSIGLNVSKQIASLIGSFYTAELLPNIKGGTNTGDVNYAFDRNVFSFRKMRAKTEFLKIIDDYFSRYGYQINKMEDPNITGRENWNYLEIGETEEIGYGEIPSKFMAEINQACRKGVTIWHNHSNLGNFNLSNNIL